MKAHYQSVLFQHASSDIATHGQKINHTLLTSSLHVCNSGVVVRALDLRLEIAGSIPAAALSSLTIGLLLRQTT